MTLVLTVLCLHGLSILGLGLCLLYVRRILRMFQATFAAQNDKIDRLERALALLREHVNAFTR